MQDDKAYRLANKNNVYSQCWDCSTTIVYQKSFALLLTMWDWMRVWDRTAAGRCLNRANERYQRKKADSAK
jgi:hypothetical protein